MKIVIFFVCIVAVLLGFLWVMGPREPVDGPMAFDPSQMGDDLDAYLSIKEDAVPGVRPAARKRIVWADPAVRERTPLSIVYVHGFSASAEEIRPVPDRVAAELGANLFFTRLTGHGRDGAAMATATVPGWISDMVEAVTIGRRIGGRVVIVGTSTGGTLAALAAFDPGIKDYIAGIVLVSPNFEVKAAGAKLLTMPWARTLVPMIIGEERSFEPRNEGHGEHWNTTYPSEAVIPMAAAVAAARALPYADAGLPLLVFISDEDTVVSPDATRTVVEHWGGTSRLVALELGDADDPGRHVIAGDIMSPGQTERVVQEILTWARAL